MRIVVDAMGSDFHPKPDVEGAVLAAREFGVAIVLVGDEKQIRPLLAAQDTAGLTIDVVHADEVLTMEDKGMALVLKAKRANAKNSMAIGIDLVKRGEAQAFVTMGNTGAASVTAYFRLGTIPGVDRPALAPALPNEKGAAVVLDVGANPDCKPNNLAEFAIMGSEYAARVRGIAQPRVGLISNGEEAGKGSQLVKDAYPLIQATGVNFVGNIEGKELFRGEVDVAVTDGFTGNVLLKSSEAVAKLLLTKIRDQLTNSGLLVKLGAAMVRPALREVRKLLDPGEHGAAPLLGVNGLVFIGHGHSDARAVKNAVRVAKQAVEANVIAAIRDAVAARLSTPPAA
ncbi:MAG: phosphate acyltransferase PlsX [Anaerolineales bacterium]|nr:phosphate acyltransferase PlsX [Anaerolineales bacterium]